MLKPAVEAEDWDPAAPPVPAWCKTELRNLTYNAEEPQIIKCEAFARKALEEDDFTPIGLDPFASGSAHCSVTECVICNLK